MTSEIIRHHFFYFLFNPVSKDFPELTNGAHTTVVLAMSGRDDAHAIRSVEISALGPVTLEKDHDITF
jgi:hypothetical protein